MATRRRNFYLLYFSSKHVLCTVYTAAPSVNVVFFIWKFILERFIVEYCDQIDFIIYLFSCLTWLDLPESSPTLRVSAGVLPTRRLGRCEVRGKGWEVKLLPAEIRRSFVADLVTSENCMRCSLYEMKGWKNNVCSALPFSALCATLVLPVLACSFHVCVCLLSLSPLVHSMFSASCVSCVVYFMFVVCWSTVGSMSFTSLTVCTLYIYMSSIVVLFLMLNRTLDSDIYYYLSSVF